MKRLNTSAITATTEMPIKSGTLDFLQDAYKETIAGLISNVINSPATGTIYILSGCVNSGSGSAYNISAGWLFLNGEIFQFEGAVFTLTGAESAYARIETTQYTTNADPVTFTDGTPRNVHDIRKIVVENTTIGSGLPKFGDFVTLQNVQDTFTTLQTNITTINSQITALQLLLPSKRGLAIGIEPGETSGSKTCEGDLVSFVYYSSESVGGFDSTTYLVTIPDVGTSSYYITSQLQSNGTIHNDNNCLSPVFKVISSTQFYWSIQANAATTQVITAHLQVYKY